MNPIELRIGNFVSDLKDNFIEVRSVFDAGIHDKEFNGVLWKNIKPIKMNLIFTKMNRV
jgi:hypothetical protein